MIGTNPFAIVSEFVSPLAMQIYVVLMFAPASSARCSTSRTPAA
jgi:hypothetical protein